MTTEITFKPGEKVLVVGPDARPKCDAVVLRDDGPPHFVVVRTAVGRGRDETVLRSSLRKKR